MDEALLTMKAKIDRLQMVYAILLGASLVILAARWLTPMPPISHLAWALALGGAVITRLQRTSLLNKYNSMLAGGEPAPME